jgi:hypothetical protein
VSPPTNSVRTAAKRKLTELLAERLPGVQVSYGYAGRDAQDECVWTDDIVDGEVTIANMGAGRKQRDDRFTILVVFTSALPSHETAEEAETRVEELYNALEDVLADYPTLDRLPGVGHAIQKGQAVGPESDPRDEGWAAFMSASVEVLSHLL